MKLDACLDCFLGLHLDMLILCSKELLLWDSELAPHTFLYLNLVLYNPYLVVIFGVIFNFFFF